MKCSIILLALAACASASIVPLSLVNSAGLVHPGLIQHPGLIHPGLISPLGHGLVSPWEHGLVSSQVIVPVQAAPIPAPVVAPVVQPGYVAATRGSVHVAPLPGNTPYASHHLNLAPAPGTH